jgi:hypothetical protein
VTISIIIDIDPTLLLKRLFDDLIAGQDSGIGSTIAMPPRWLSSEEAGI